MANSSPLAGQPARVSMPTCAPRRTVGAAASLSTARTTMPSLAYALGKRMLPVGRSVAMAAPFPEPSPRMAYMVTSTGCDKGESSKPGARGVPSPSPGMYPASVRRYTGPMPLFSQSGFTPSFSKSVIYQAPGTDCRLLASAMLDCLIARISASSFWVRVRVTALIRSIVFS